MKTSNSKMEMKSLQVRSYALVSRDIQRADLDLWRGDAVAVTDGKGDPLN